MKKNILIVTIIGVFACNSSPQEKQTELNPEETQLETRQDSLFNEVMAIHDEVMPEMDHIFRLQKNLKQVADSLEEQSVSSSVSADSLRAISIQLKEADDAMMNWMRSNDFQFEGMEHEDIMQELTSEKESIVVVRDKMMNSIQLAEEVLQKFENP